MKIYDFFYSDMSFSKLKVFLLRDDFRYYYTRQINDLDLAE